MLEESGPPCGAALAGGPGLGALPGHTDPRTCETSRLRAALAGRARIQGPSQLTSPHQTGLTNHPRKEERSHKSDRKNLSFQKRSGKRVGPARGPETQSIPAGEGENQALPGVSPSPSLTTEMWKRLWKIQFRGIIDSVRGRKIQDSCDNR